MHTDAVDPRVLHSLGIQADAPFLPADRRPDQLDDQSDSTPVYGRWWVWTLVGVAVVGGGLGVYLATSGDAGSNGTTDDPPGSLVLNW